MSKDITSQSLATSIRVNPGRTRGRRLSDSPAAPFAALIAALALGCGSGGPSSGDDTSAGSVQAAAGGQVVVSTFESGLGSSFQMDWRAINDNPAGGTSTAMMELVSGGAAGTQKALHVTGVAKVQDFPFPFAGLALPLGPISNGKPAPVDISKHTGLRFWARGNGKRYLVRPQGTDVKDFNYHHYVFTAGPEWQQHAVQFSNLVQFDWGEKVPWTGKSIAALVFVNYSAPGEDFGAIDFTVDEVELF